MPTVKAVWIDAGNDADVTKLGLYGITAPYFDPRDQRVTAAYLERLRGQGFSPGLYFAWDWYPQLGGAAFASKVDAELRRISWGGNPPVCLDIETHDVGYILACLERWRTLRPTRQTDLTLEGMQGGLFSPQAVSEIVHANIRIAPSFYAGDMSPLGHSVILDLLMAGFPGERLLGMYDAAALPYRWTGYAFTQGRLL